MYSAIINCQHCSHVFVGLPADQFKAEFKFQVLHILSRCLACTSVCVLLGL